MSFYQQAAEMLQYIVPQFYKKRFFKKLKGLDKNNFTERNAEPELAWLKDYLKKDDVFVDVGANVGAYLFALENALLPHNIFAFEPNQNLYRRLQRIFPKINLSDVALSDKNTTAEFKVPIIGGKKIASRGTLQKDFREKDEEKSAVETVTVRTFDSWADENNLSKISFIKIDVEGNEMQTLSGAKKVIEKFRPVLMVEMEQRHHTEPLANLIAEIEDFGYAANFLDRETFEIKKLPMADFFQDEKQHKNHQSYINNIIFLPKK